ncbi:MAG: SEC-C domain-containing protein [Nitrospirae bacterium]|nr:SEC-C domain-containing protein [Nitrospirota bacterium]
MKTGRNDPCPCGSGKKYKKCCLAESVSAAGREEPIQKSLVQDLLKFYHQNFAYAHEDANLLFWDNFIPEEHLEGHFLDIAMQNFFEWIVFDFPIDEDGNKTLIDYYLEQNRRLSLDEHKVLIMMKNSVISLYEVQEVFPEKGLLLKDLILGGEYDVMEKAATRSLKKWDIFACRLLHLDGKYVMSGSVYPYHLKFKRDILDDIYGEYEDYRRDNPAAAMDEFLKLNSEIFNFYWFDIIQNPVAIKMHTSSGEPILFSKAIFEIRDRDAVLQGVPAIKGFEQRRDAFTWFDKRKADGSSTILGRVEIEGSKLILETNSKKRLEKGKQLLLKALPDALIHKLDSFQDPTEAIKSYKERPGKEPENNIPFDVQQALYTQFMQKHCEKWLTEKIPALNGKTPMQAVKAQDGKRMVIDLLKQFENGQEYNKREGRPTYDLSWMWERLGLDRG